MTPWVPGETEEERANRQAKEQREFHRLELEKEKASMVQSINEPGTPAFEEVAGQVKPAITAIVPDTCAIDDADFTLDITGEGFGPSTVIFFAGHTEPTTFDGVDTVSTGVKPALWGSPATVQVYVVNGTLHSDPVDFTFTDAAGATRGGKKGEVKQVELTLTGLNPDHAPAGAGPDLLLRVFGTGFDKHCKIVFDDEEMITSYEDDRALTAWVPSATTPSEVDVEVARGDDLTEVLTFEFVEKGGSGRKGKAVRKEAKATPAHKRAKKK
jgi:hypothetical protein